MRKRLIFGFIIPGCLVVTASMLFFQAMDDWVAIEEDCPGTLSCVLDFGDGYVANLTMVVPQNETVYLAVDIPNALMDQFTPPQAELAGDTYVYPEAHAGGV